MVCISIHVFMQCVNVGFSCNCTQVHVVYTVFIVLSVITVAVSMHAFHALHEE